MGTARGVDRDPRVGADPARIVGHPVRVPVDQVSEALGEPDWMPWTPAQVAREMVGLEVPWCVTAGWAVDLFVGRQTREHEDLEVAIPAAGWPASDDASPRWSSWSREVGACGRWRARLSRSSSRPGAGTRPVQFRIDVFRDPHVGDTWICRRDARIRRPYSTLIRTTPDGVPFMAPEVVLLFKAKHDRDKDRADLDVCLTLMTDAEKAWLAHAIMLVHPGHPWRAMLG